MPAIGAAHSTQRRRNSFVVITGCYAQLKPKEIAEIPGVDLVLGASEKFNIALHLKELAKGDSAKNMQLRY